MSNIRPKIGLGNNEANLREWKQLFGELAQGYIDPAEPRKLAEGEGWGAGTGKLLHKYFFDMPVGALRAMGDLFDRGMQDPEAISPLDYTASTADALFASMPGGGTGVANIGKRDALKMLGRSGTNLAKFLGKKSENSLLDQGLSATEAAAIAKYDTKSYFNRVKDSILATKDLPQAELDRIRSIAWTPRAAQSEYGNYSPNTKDVRLTHELMRASGNKETPDTLFHEMTHARQWTPDRKISEIIKARALRKASEDMPYKRKPIEQLARITAKDILTTGEGFETAYTRNLDSYLEQAKEWDKLFGTHNSDIPGQGQWSKLAPHLREGLELAKKLPEAKKKIKKLRFIADKADQNLKALSDKGAPTDLLNRALRIRAEANQRQVPYYQYFNELGLEYK